MSCIERAPISYRPFDVYEQYPKTLSERMIKVSKVGLSCLGKMWIAGSFTALTASVPLVAGKVAFYAIGMFASNAVISASVQIACSLGLIAVFSAIIAPEGPLEKTALIVSAVVSGYALFVVADMSFLLVAAAGIGFTVSSLICVASEDYIHSLAEMIDHVAKIEILVASYALALGVLIAAASPIQLDNRPFLNEEDRLSISNWLHRKVNSLPIRKLIQPIQVPYESRESRDRKFLKVVLIKHLQSISSDRRSEICENLQNSMPNENGLMLLPRLVVGELIFSEQRLNQNNTPLFFEPYLTRLNDLRDRIQILSPMQKEEIGSWVERNDIDSENLIVKKLLRDITFLTWNDLYPPNNKNNQYTSLSQFLADLDKEQFWSKERKSF